MTVKAGRKANLKIAGTPISFLDEATETADNKTFSLVDQFKKIWDHSTPVYVYVNAERVIKGFKVERAAGRIIFDKPLGPGSVVTITGGYVTTSKLGLASNVSFDTTREAYDITAFTDEYKRSLAGLKSGSGSFSDFDVSNPMLLRALDDDYVFIEIFDDYENEVDAIKAWVTLSSKSLSASVTDAQKLEISFETVGYFSN